MGFGTRFEMGIYQKIHVVTIVAFKSCQSSKRVLGPFVLDRGKTDEFVRRPNLCEPRIPLEMKRHAMPFGAWYTEYQPEIIFLGPFGEGNAFVANLK